MNRKTQYENPVTQAKGNNKGPGVGGSPSGSTTGPTTVTGPPPPGPPGPGNASSTDSGNSTYPRLKKQQNQQQQQQNESGGPTSNPPAPMPKRANSESRLNLYYGGNWSLSFLSFFLTELTNGFLFGRFHLSFCF